MCKGCLALLVLCWVWVYIIAVGSIVYNCMPGLYSCLSIAGIHYPILHSQQQASSILAVYQGNSN